jgi:hypothetical protein
MKLPFLRQSFAALALLTLSATLSLAQTSGNVQSTGVITGRVTIDDKPAAGVLVGLMRTQPTSMSEGGALVKVATDAEGRYRLAQVPAGSFRVAPLAPGYVAPSESPNPFESGKAVNVREDETVENLNFSLARGGVITGKVMDASGKPLVEQRLSLMKLEANGRKTNWNPSYEFSYYMLMTDDRGIYRLYGLPEGRYIISAGSGGPNDTSGRVRGNSYLRTFYPDTTDENQAKAIEAAPGSETKDIDIRLINNTVKGYTVAVRVLDNETNAPLVGVSVSYMPFRGERMMGGINMATTDALGVARFDGVMAGRYGVSFFNVGPQPNEYFSEPVVFEVVDSDLEGVELRAQRGATISGKAIIEGTNDQALMARLTELWISAYSRPLNPRTTPAMPSFGGNFKLNRDGSFRVSGLAPGRVQFNASGERELAGLSLQRFEVEGVPQKDGIEVTVGQQIANARLVFVYGQTIVRGQVQVINGTLPEGARVMLSARRTDAAATIGGKFTQVDARGRFTLAGMAAGEYELTLTAMPSLQMIVVSPSSGNAPSPPPPIRPLGTVKQKIIVPAAGEVPAALTLDLAAQENKR